MAAMAGSELMEGGTMTDESVTVWPTPAGMREAWAAIRPHVPATPLLRSDLLSRACGAELWLKHETATPIASFKLRGGLNGAMRAAASGARRVAASSTGN